MGAFNNKVLWVTSLGSPSDEQIFADHAAAAGVNTVCIRSSYQGLPEAIFHFHSLGIRVYAWRWPAVNPQPSSSTHYFATDEANYVANVLISAQLDGYIVDPESDTAGADNDWNNPAVTGLATAFCQTIKNAAAAAGRPFRFGLTSGCNYPTAAGKPNIPWAVFVDASDVLLPQTYWRMANAPDDVLQINGGTPQAAIARGQNAWDAIAKGRPIVPMAGEIDVITSSDITAYGATLTAQGIGEAHFYTDNFNVPPANFAAIKAL